MAIFQAPALQQLEGTGINIVQTNVENPRLLPILGLLQAAYKAAMRVLQSGEVLEEFAAMDEDVSEDLAESSSAYTFSSEDSTEDAEEVADEEEDLVESEVNQEQL
eukprot:CAMPEP_0177529690 /NCGR_PEP_ID=MMETSP0369-20130122/52961_1 /TAXON_ID=447022 ORGANISM="Scrippsiella hangoei-like, Strain SHHI-4" /NCGR_SAMPLE_ID=MMETSP0369 /ASSEMBLY_ACC=CAM_ASM_000364 /LENGTH=105 /DNA_ID=CAMNT_0019010417 /DNA_START=89 /DNA_END=407 /DNA_ORIENTATION=-